MLNVVAHRRPVRPAADAKRRADRYDNGYRHTELLR